MRKWLSRFTSPLFVPLRRFVIWGDRKFGTCDYRLSLEPRWESPLDGFADVDEETVFISELQRKVSKDKANLIGLGEQE